ncbi:MAG: sugar phosphate nucleotidyltransferase, partial [TACK group archaeon]|nr:sugar phosphate nucleotidyltransferase [TACK group archaeon]
PNPPSNLAITAVYAFSARSMSAISSVKPGRTGESELTDAISELAKEGRAVALVMDEDEVWLSVGNPEAYHNSLNVSYELAKTHLRD